MSKLALRQGSGKRFLYDEDSHHEVTVTGVNPTRLAEAVESRYNAFEPGGAVAEAKEALEEMLADVGCLRATSCRHPLHVEARRALARLEQEIP